MKITQDEIEFFNENGYLIKRDMLDPTLISQCLDYYWRSAPEGFHRDDPSTWQGEIWKNAFTRDRVAHNGYDWKDFSLEETAYGNSLIAKNESIRDGVIQLSGAPIKNAKCRGIFGVLPRAPGRGFHIDGPRISPFIGVTGYLGDVGPNAGNFTFYPKSHLPISQLIADGILDLHKDKNRDMYNHKLWMHVITEEPIQFVGNTGDIVFWHDSLVHRYTQNRSKHIRFAMFVDFYLEKV